MNMVSKTDVFPLEDGREVPMNQVTLTEVSGLRPGMLSWLKLQTATVMHQLVADRPAPNGTGERRQMLHVKVTRDSAQHQDLRDGTIHGTADGHNVYIAPTYSAADVVPQMGA